MKHSIYSAILTLPAALLVAQPSSQGATFLTPLTSYAGPASSSEIVAHDSFQQLLYNTYGVVDNAGVEIIDFANPASLTQAGTIDMSNVAGLAVRSISSVAADPLGRGFGVAAFIPKDAGSNPGRVVFFDPAARTVLHSVEVGYHPDNLRFSNDGSKIFVANEGEPISEGASHFDRPGSLSIIDVSSIASAAQISTLGAGHVATHDFSAANLTGGVDLNSVRVHPSNNSPAGRVNDVEPEYITQAGNKLYVTLQENNAVAEFDLAQGQWTAVRSLGTIQQTIDASSNDGGVNINDVVHGLPMPDGIASFAAGGGNYYITANEGDARPADNLASGHPNGASDEARFQQLGTSGRPALDAATDTALDALYGGDAQANGALGRLRVSLIDGNLDADAEIEQPTMFGTRSFSIWDAATGVLVFDSGSDFETITASEVAAIFNSNGTAATFDARSQNKGPEPEGAEIGTAFGQTFAFIGLERVGGVMVYNVTDPFNAHFVDYVNTGEISPEGLEFVPADKSPTGLPLLVVGYEVDSKVAVYALAQVPDSGLVWPCSAVALLVAGALRRKQH